MIHDIPALLDEAKNCPDTEIESHISALRQRLDDQIPDGERNLINVAIHQLTFRKGLMGRWPGSCTTNGYS